MRPVRPGVYGSDLAAVARVRRRIASDESQPVAWRRRMITICDELHAALSEVVTKKLLEGDKARKKRTTPTAPAADS